MTLVGLGAGCPGEAAGCPGSMQGRAEYSCCCFPSNTWSNETYVGKKGWLSFYYWVERRVRHALTFFTPEAIADFAYDNSLSSTIAVPDYLVEAGREATENWYAVWPKGRWTKTGRGVATDCTSVGYYRAWEPTVPNPPEVVQQTADRLTGKTGAESQTLFCGNPQCSPPYSPESIVGRLAEHIKNGPGNEGPTNIEFLSPRESYLVIENGAVAPAPWAKTLLELLAPVAMGKRSSALKLGRAMPAMAVSRAATSVATARAIKQTAATSQQAAISREAPSGPEDEGARLTRPKPKSNALPAVLVGGSVMLLGYAGWRVYKKRLRRRR